MTTITFNPANFRVVYPQFADPGAFPDLKLQSQFDLSTAYISPEVYGDMPQATLGAALDLMTAHLLSLGVIVAQNNFQGQVGVVTGATVDGIAITLAPPPVRSQWRFWLNTTPYGMQLTSLLEMQSSGGFFVGGLPERAAFRRVGGVFL
jgi:hypothetical protein